MLNMMKLSCSGSAEAAPAALGKLETIKNRI